MPNRVIEPQGAHRIERLLHWMVALAFILLLVGADLAHDWASNSAERRELYYWHGSLGTLFVGLLLLRFAVASRLESGMKLFPQTAAQRILRFCLWGLLLLLPFSGLASTLADGKPVPLFDLFAWTLGEALWDHDLSYYLEELHLWLGWAAYILLVLHAGAVLICRWVRVRKLGTAK